MTSIRKDTAPSLSWQPIVSSVTPSLASPSLGRAPLLAPRVATLRAPLLAGMTRPEALTLHETFRARRAKTQVLAYSIVGSWGTGAIGADLPHPQLIAAMKANAIRYANGSGVGELYSDYGTTVEELLGSKGPRIVIEMIDQEAMRRRVGAQKDVSIFGYVDPSDPDTLHIDARIAKYPRAGDVVLHELMHHLELKASGRSSERVATKIDQMLERYHLNGDK